MYIIIIFFNPRKNEGKKKIRNRKCWKDYWILLLLLLLLLLCWNCKFTDKKLNKQLGGRDKILTNLFSPICAESQQLVVHLEIKINMDCNVASSQ